jgi:hypothetical protein
MRVASWLAGLIVTFPVACGGSSDTTAAPSTQELIDDLCGKLAALDCARPDEAATCHQQAQEDQADAAQEGCEAELNAYYHCAATKAVYCGGSMETAPHPMVADDCSDLRTAFGVCWSRLDPLCGVGVGMGTCSINCSNLSSACTGPDPNGPVDCVCDSGPKTGTTFQATDCSKNLIWATGHQCQ